MVGYVAETTRSDLSWRWRKLGGADRSPASAGRASRAAEIVLGQNEVLIEIRHVVLIFGSFHDIWIEVEARTLDRSFGLL